MKISTCLLPFALALFFAVPLHAQDGSDGQATTASKFSEWLGLPKNLRLEPKAISSTNGERSTVGLEYSYNRRFKDISLGGETDLYFESAGVIAADDSSSSTRQHNHKLRLHVIDLFSDSRRGDFELYRDPKSLDEYRVLKKEFRFGQSAKWDELLDLYLNYPDAVEDPDSSDVTAEQMYARMQVLWREVRGTELSAPTKNATIAELDAHLDLSFEDLLRRHRVHPEDPWLSFELNTGAETDQDFSDVQYVGGARLYGKLPWLAYPADFLLSGIRGYGNEQVVNDFNYEGGPYLWAGLDFVDASDNQARRMVTGGSDDSFARVNAGLTYRNEVYSFGVDSRHGLKTVSLDLSWNFYAELDAPAAVRMSDMDTHSYFKASLLFDDGIFLEYTDGSQPLDRRSSSAVAIGWRTGR